MAAFTVRETSWATDATRLAVVRRAVFIDEQGVPEALEWDEHDAGSRHFLALDAAGHPIGCARLLPDGHIGRMAVVQAWRGRGVGRALLAATVTVAAQQGHAAVQLSAQVHAAGFYARHGFAAVGPEYEEAGIPHVAMVKRFAA
jgi:predicted GNAT family N-acyltransferase